MLPIVIDYTDCMKCIAEMVKLGEQTMSSSDHVGFDVEKGRDLLKETRVRSTIWLINWLILFDFILEIGLFHYLYYLGLLQICFLVQINLIFLGTKALLFQKFTLRATFSEQSNINNRTLLLLRRLASRENDLSEGFFIK